MDRGSCTVYALLLCTPDMDIDTCPIRRGLQKKCSLGAQISGGGGVTLIRAMPRFKVFFMCVLP